MLTISKGVSLMKIALIAHDRKKPMMVKLATAYKTILEKHELFCYRDDWAEDHGSNRLADPSV